MKHSTSLSHSDDLSAVTRADLAAALTGTARAPITLGQVTPSFDAASNRVDWSKFAPRPTGPVTVDRATGTATGLAFETYGFTDPELTHQWHLGYVGDLSTVWKDYTGKGVSVGIYDSGTQYVHWDLAANYDASKHIVINGVTIDGFANATDAHGTSVGGIIAAARNGEGGVGIAYGASITGVNIFGPSEIAVNGSPGFFDAMRQGIRFDVVNHSWGGGPNIRGASSRSNPGNFESSLADAFKFVADNGRGGLGTISVTASGNNAQDGIGEGAKSDRHQVAVAAYREIDGSVTSYSTRGANILVAAPSNDFDIVGGRGTVTTDILGTGGYNLAADQTGAHDYTDTFGGTSSAAPKVTAMVALMLDANASLGWRDVHAVLAASSRMPVAFETGVTSMTLLLPETQGGPLKPIEVAFNNGSFGLNGSQANWNGGRMHFSNDYGYGAIDAHAAVRMAEIWSLFGPAKTSANETSLSSRTFDVGIKMVADPAISNTIVTYGDRFIGTPERFTFDLEGGIDLEHLDMTVNFTSRYLLDPTIVEGIDPKASWAMTGVKMRLTAPDGSVSFIDTDFIGTNTVSDAGDAQSFTFGFANLRHADSAGTWTIEFEQLMPAPLNVLGIFQIPYKEAETTIHSLKFDRYGAAPTNDDVFTYTNEYVTMLAIEGEGGRRTLSDTDGGTDWINAAAVTANVHLSLTEGGRTLIGGRTAFTVAAGTQIEHAVTGDGNDRLMGNMLDNKLYGMRGDDWLNGDAGNDTLFGGAGNDVFAFDTNGVSGADRILDWRAGDRIATSKQLRGADRDGLVTAGTSALLLLDGTTRGDTAELVDQGGAVLKAMGRTLDGYWWYSFVSGGDADFVDGRVTERALGQAEVADAGVIATAGAHFADAANPSVAITLQDSAFFLYNAMGDAMAGGAVTYA